LIKFQVTLVEVERGQDITLLVQTQGGEYRYQFGITQVQFGITQVQFGITQVQFGITQI